jgi:hypothetical protein
MKLKSNDMLGHGPISGAESGRQDETLPGLKQLQYRVSRAQTEGPWGIGWLSDNETFKCLI